MSDQGTPPGGDAPARPPAKRVAKKAAPRPAGAAPAGGTRGPAPSDDGPASTLALALIAATVVIGLVVFFKGIQHDGSVETGSGTNATTTTTSAPNDRNAAPTTTTPSQAGTITTPPSTKAPADVNVYVVNSADPAQTLAGPMATELTSLGYTVTGRVDGPVSSESNVWYIPGYEGDAKAIATAIGFGTSTVAPLPDPAPVTVPPGTAIVVSIGTDKAADVAAGQFGSGSTSGSSGSTSGTTTTTR